MIEFLNTEFGYILLGSIVGIVLGLTGSGGGIISLPLLVFIVGLKLTEAIPISLMSTCISAYIGAFIGFRNGLLRWRAALYMFLVGLVTTPIGLFIAHKTPQDYLILIFIVLLILGIKAMIQKIRGENDTTKPQIEICKLNEFGKFIWDKQAYKAMGAIGLIVGFFSGLLGAGGGFVIIPALSKITKLAMDSITTTSLGVVALVGTSNIALSAATGHVNWNIGLFFTIGAGLGMIIGSYFCEKLPQIALQYLYLSISILTVLGFSTSLIIKHI